MLSLIRKLFISAEYRTLRSFHRSSSLCRQCRFWRGDCYYGGTCPDYAKYKAAHRKA